MTANKMKKRDIMALFDKVNPKEFDKTILLSIKQVIKNEVSCSLNKSGSDEHLIERNLYCFNKMFSHIQNENLEEAWWELTDIISYRQDDEYISVDEIVLLDIALMIIINEL